MVSKRYNYCTLIPKDNHDKKAFWDFRNEKIRQEYTYWFILNCILWTILLITYLVEGTQENIDNLLAYSVFMVISIVILLLNSRFTSTIYLLPILYLISNIMHITLAKQNGDELNLEKWSFKKFRQITYERTLIEGDYYSFIILFSPNVYYAMFIYTPVFIVIRWIQLDYRYDLNDEMQL